VLRSRPRCAAKSRQPPEGSFPGNDAKEYRLVAEYLREAGRRERAISAAATTNAIMADRNATAAAEIATLRQKLAAAEARIREIEDKDNALKPANAWLHSNEPSTLRPAGT
jgi:hypothetical protein